MGGAASRPLSKAWGISQRPRGHQASQRHGCRPEGRGFGDNYGSRHEAARLWRDGSNPYGDEGIVHELFFPQKEFSSLL